MTKYAVFKEISKLPPEINKTFHLTVGGGLDTSHGGAAAPFTHVFQTGVLRRVAVLLPTIYSLSIIASICGSDERRLYRGLFFFDLLVFVCRLLVLCCNCTNEKELNGAITAMCVVCRSNLMQFLGVCVERWWITCVNYKHISQCQTINGIHLLLDILEAHYSHLLIFQLTKNRHITPEV